MPLPVNNSSLINELRATVSEIDKTIAGFKAYVETQTWIDLKNNEVQKCDPYLQMDHNGMPVLAPLLASKAQCLSAIANLQAKR